MGSLRSACLILLAVAATLSVDGSRVSAQDSDVSITQPAPGRTVNSPAAVAGAVRARSSGEKLWILIQPAGHEWWVQRPPAISRSGQWHISRACFGEKR